MQHDREDISFQLQKKIIFKFQFVLSVYEAGCGNLYKKLQN